jgi:arginine deiminase
VHEAQKDHYDFVLKVRDRGVEVLDLHDLLAETLVNPKARAWVLDRRITDNDVGPGTAPVLRAWLDQLPAGALVEHLLGGVAISELPTSDQSAMLADAYGPMDFIVPPIPNALFQRDPSCWIYGGVTCNPMFWSARKPETLLQRAVYKFHPRFAHADFTIWWGASDEHFGGATLEGGDVMPIGKASSSAWANARRARRCFSSRQHSTSAATRVIGCLMPQTRGHASRHHLHLLRRRSRHGVPRVADEVLLSTLTTARGTPVVEDKAISSTS